MVDEGKIYFLSRPRKFGKSLLISTLESYFTGRKELFEGLAIDSLENDWFEYPVFHIDFNNGEYEQEGGLRGHISSYISDWEKIYGSDPSKESLGERFRYILNKAYAKTGRKCVVLVDEYDKPKLGVLDTPMEDVNRNIPRLSILHSRVQTLLCVLCFSLVSQNSRRSVCSAVSTSRWTSA